MKGNGSKKPNLAKQKGKYSPELVKASQVCREFPSEYNSPAFLAYLGHNSWPLCFFLLCLQVQSALATEFPSLRKVSQLWLTILLGKLTCKVTFERGSGPSVPISTTVFMEPGKLFFLRQILSEMREEKIVLAWNDGSVGKVLEFRSSVLM